MNKNQLVEAIANEAGTTKAQAEATLNAFIGTVTKQLKKGQKISLVGFGTFDIAKRKATQGRNPRTGETIQIKASNQPKFRPGKALKDAVN